MTQTIGIGCPARSNVQSLAPEDILSDVGNRGVAHSGTFDWSLARLQVPSDEFDKQWRSDMLGTSEKIDLSAFVLERAKNSSVKWMIKIVVDGTIYDYPVRKVYRDACCAWRSQLWLQNQEMNMDVNAVGLKAQYDQLSNMMEEHLSSVGEWEEKIECARNGSILLQQLIKLGHSEEERVSQEKALQTLNNVGEMYLKTMDEHDEADPALDEEIDQLRIRLGQIKSEENWNFIKCIHSGVVAEVVETRMNELITSDLGNASNLGNETVSRGPGYVYVSQYEAENEETSLNSTEMRQRFHEVFQKDDAQLNLQLPFIATGVHSGNILLTTSEDDKSNGEEAIIEQETKSTKRRSHQTFVHGKKQKT